MQPKLHNSIMIKTVVLAVLEWPPIPVSHVISTRSVLMSKRHDICHGSLEALMCHEHKMKFMSHDMSLDLEAGFWICSTSFGVQHLCKNSGG